MISVTPSQAEGRCAGLKLSTPRIHYPACRLSSGPASVAHFTLRTPAIAEFVRRSDPALRIVTDFTKSTALTVAETRGIQSALDDMFRYGTRALIALSDDGEITGLVTSYDIEGEPAREFLERNPDRVPDSVTVRDVFTPFARLPTVRWTDLEQAQIGDLVELFRIRDVPYLIALERQDDDSPMYLRGLISRTTLERRLGSSL